MTDTETLPETGALVSAPEHVQLHDAGWVSLPSGIEITRLPLWDDKHQLFARMGWDAADEWLRAHGWGLPTAGELDELHAIALHIEPVCLPTQEMCAAEIDPVTNRPVPFNWKHPAYKRYQARSMRSHAWCKIHDDVVSEALSSVDWWADWYEGGGPPQPIANAGKHWCAPAGGIYGWWRDNGTMIQGLSRYHAGDPTYTDYATTVHAVRDAPKSTAGDGEPQDSEGLPDPSSWRPVLRRGMTGRDVEAWQTQLTKDGADLAVDGDFGGWTEAATRAWQAERHLVTDGVVGPITRDAIGTPPVPLPDQPPLIVAGSELLPDPMLLLQAANYTRGHVARDWFVLHSTEGTVSNWVPLGIARWCAGQNWAGHPVKPPRASWHYVVGSHPVPYHGVIRCLDEEHTAWTAGRRRVNERSIQVEMNGRAMSSDWSGPSMELTLRRTAALFARAADRWDMPIREVSTVELREARRMIDDDPTCVLPERCRGGISHADVTEVWEVPGGHIDPGGRDDRRWPWELFLGYVRGSSAIPFPSLPKFDERSEFS